MKIAANIEMNDVKAAFKRILNIGDRVYYETYHKYPTDSKGLFKSHFKGIASYKDQLIFTHTNLNPDLSRLDPLHPKDIPSMPAGPGKIMIADKQISGDQASISAIYDTTSYHEDWSHPCSTQACGSFMAMGIQATEDGNDCVAEIHILDLTALDIGVQPKSIAAIEFTGKENGKIKRSAVNGVAMTKEHGNNGKYIVAGLQGHALTIYRSVNSYLTSNPEDNKFNVVGYIEDFPRSGAGIALITQTNGDIYIVALDADDDGDNRCMYLCQLIITDSSVTCSGVLDSMPMKVPGLSEAVRFATNGWVIEEIARPKSIIEGGGDSDIVLSTFLTTFASGIQNINTLNTSFRWGKGLAITSPDTFEVYSTDRNDLTTSRFNKPVDTKKDFSLVTWRTTPNLPLFLTTQGDDGIYLIDAKAKTPSRIPSTAGLDFQCVTAVGDFLYLITPVFDGIYIFDTKNPNQKPYQIPSTFECGFRKMVAVGDLLYLTTTGLDGIFVFDTKNQKLYQIGSTAGMGFQDVTALDNLLYLTAQGSDGIYIFDITNPDQKPQQIPSTAHLDFRSVLAAGNFLYLITPIFDGVYILDTKNPNQKPYQIPSTIGFGFRNMMAVGDLIYLTTTGLDGIFIFDTKTPTVLPRQMQSTAGYGFQDLIVLDNLLYYATAQSSDGIYISDARNTDTRMLQIPSTAGYGFRNIIESSNDGYLNLTTHGNDGIYQFITLNLNIGQVPPAQFASTSGFGFEDLVQVGDLLYLTVQGNGGIYTRYIPDAHQKPTLIPSTAEFYFQNVIALGHLLYLTTQDPYGIYIFDTKNPDQKPYQILSTNGFHFWGIASLGNLLYLTSHGDGIYIFDTKNPDQKPTQIPSTDGLGFRGITTVGELLYLTTHSDDGVYVFDTETNLRPTQIPSTADHGFWGITRGSFY